VPIFATLNSSQITETIRVSECDVRRHAHWFSICLETWRNVSGWRGKGYVRDCVIPGVVDQQQSSGESSEFLVVNKAGITTTCTLPILYSTYFTLHKNNDILSIQYIS